MLFQGLSTKTYSRVYFSLCLFLVISGRSRTQRKRNPHEKFPIYGIMLRFVFAMQAKKLLLQQIDNFIEGRILLAAKAISDYVKDERKINDGDVIVVFSW